MGTKIKYLFLIGVSAVAFSTVPASSNNSSAGSGPSPAHPDGSEGGTISGTAKMAGSQDAAARINMATDPACLKIHPAPVMSEEVVTGTNGALKNVVVYISDGLGAHSFDPPKEPAVLEQKGCAYSPRILAVRARQTFELVNSDPTSHNIHPAPQNNREWNIFQPPGSSPIEETFAREEIIPVKCNVHPWMKGYIAVFKHPYFAITDKDGAFDLKNVPPGDYVIQAWHEKYGVLNQKVTLGPNQTKTVDFVFKP
jgi:plastocyanin